MKPRATLSALFALLALTIVDLSAQAQKETASKNEAPTESAGYRPAPSPNEGKVRTLPTYASTKGSKVVVVAIDETVELALTAIVRRAVREHEDAALIILDVNTLGGRVDAAIQIRDALLEAKTPTLAYVHPRAISAGALISLACDTIIMGKGGTIGAATPVIQGGELEGAKAEKMTSYMRAEMRATAEANGRRGDIAEAMVDASVVIDGISENGKLLTLDTDRAVELGVADGVAENLDEVLKLVGANAPVVEKLETNWGEVIARWLTSPAVSGLLTTFGMLGVMVAFYTRSIGPFSIVGFVCLALFFGGHAVVNLVGWEEMFLFVAGAVMLGVEIVAIPGFGLMGAAGLVLLLLALVFSLNGLPIPVALDDGLLANYLGRVMVSVLGSIVALMVVLRFLPKTALGKGLVLDAKIDGKSAPQISLQLVGSSGVALTDLQPMGKIEIGTERYDATSERRYIDRGTPIVVIKIHENLPVVRAVEGEKP